jgi:hypothetical protein
MHDDANNNPWQRTWILLCALAAIAQVVGAAIGLYGGMQEKVLIFFAGWLLLLPATLVNTFTALNVCSMTWEYSWLGSKLPRNPPADWNPAVFSGTHGGVGYFGMRASSPFVTWSVGEQGIAVRMDSICRAFVPHKELTSLEKGWTGDFLHHTSPEVRTPLFMPRDVGEAVAATFFAVSPAVSSPPPR